MNASTAKRAVMVAISIAYVGLRGVLRLLGIGCRRYPIVLTYHAVTADELSRFERQMDLVRKHGTLVFAGDGESNPRPRRIAVTFDDAFQHVFDDVLPLLKRLQIPVTIFVPTGYVGQIPGWTREFPEKDLDRVASTDSMKAVDPSLVRLGSHTVTHPRLGTLNRASLDYELKASREWLQRFTGKPVDCLSLPYGSCGEQVLEAAAAAGYAAVFSNVPDDRRRPLLIGRTNVSPSDWPIEFRLKVVGGYEWMASALPAKRQMFQFLGWPQEA